MASVLKAAMKGAGTCKWCTSGECWTHGQIEKPAKGAGKKAGAVGGKGAGAAAAVIGAAGGKGWGAAGGKGAGAAAVIGQAGGKGWGAAGGEDPLSMMKAVCGKGKGKGWADAPATGGKASKGDASGAKGAATWSLPPWALSQGAKTAGGKAAAAVAAPAGGKDGKSNGKSKGKGKGKGKSKEGVPPADDIFWVNKLSEENRQEGDGSTYSGKVVNYMSKAGWGFILPDAPEDLPEDVQQALLASKQEAESRGKKIKQDNFIYFRKPDLLNETCEKDQMCTFQLYFDDKGVGAHNITVF